MPYNLQWKDRMVIFEYFGEVTSEDILQSNEAVYGDSRFDMLRWELVFFDEVKSVSYVERDVKKIAFCDRAAHLTNPKIQVVFVGEADLLKDLYELYYSFVEETCWPTIQLDTREQAWSCLRELNAI